MSLRELIQAMSLVDPQPLGPRAALLRKRILLTLLVLVIGWGATDVRRRGRVIPGNPGAHRTDLTVYTEAGAAFFDGRPPYEVTNLRGWHYLYPPLFALVLAPLHALPPTSQVLVWFAISAACVVGSVLEMRRIWRFLLARHPSLGALPPWLGVLPWVAVFMPTAHCLQRGQVGAALLFLLLWGLRVFLTSERLARAAAAGAILALPVVIKVTPALPVGMLAIAQCLRAAADRRQRARTIGLGAGLALGGILYLLLIPASLVGWNANRQHLARWHELVVSSDGIAHNSQLAAQYPGFALHAKKNQSLANGVLQASNWWRRDADREAGDAARQLPPSLEQLVRGVKLAAVGLLMALAFFSRGQESHSVVTMYALAMLATFILSPVAWGHYYVFLWPAALFVPVGLWIAGWRTAACAASLATPLITCTSYALVDQLTRASLLAPLLSLGVTSWFFASGLLLSRSSTLTARRATLTVPRLKRVTVRRTVIR